MSVEGDERHVERERDHDHARMQDQVAQEDEEGRFSTISTAPFFR